MNREYIARDALHERRRDAGLDLMVHDRASWRMNDTPIFIHGIWGRSGTNFLARLIGSHPDCSLLATPPEDWVLYECHHLQRYVSALGRRWTTYPEWNVGPEQEGRLLRYLGDGVLSFLGEKVDGGRLVTKTPAMGNVDSFFSLFRDARLVILIRDGRSVVESAVRSFRDDPNPRLADPDFAAQSWAWGARKILAFDEKKRGSGLPYRIVRYEDLLADCESELRNLFEVLDLDPARFDFDQARQMPVFGSSGNKARDGGWQWSVTESTGDERFTRRWSHWSRRQHERFNWIAGDELKALGYAPMEFETGRTAWRALRGLWRVSDAASRAVGRLSLAGRRKALSRLESGVD